MTQFYAWLGKKKSARIRLAVMDMWKPFRTATAAHVPKASILFDKFHVMRHLGEALDTVRKSEYARLGRDEGMDGQVCRSGSSAGATGSPRT